MLDAIQKHNGKGARIFTFGVGNSVNRFLIDAMSRVGKGDSEVVTLGENADAAVARFLNRTQTPILTNVGAKFEGVAVQDVLPATIPDVFDQKPVVLYGRYSSPGTGTVTITGQLGSKVWTKSVALNFAGGSDAGALPSLWARQKIEELTGESYLATTHGASNGNRFAEAITETALEFGVMSQYTSFVAVEPKVINVGGKQRLIHVPVEMADGVSYSAIDTDSGNATPHLRQIKAQAQGTLAMPVVTGGGKGAGAGGFGGGGGGGFTLGTNFNIANAKSKDMPEQLRAAIDPETKIAKSLKAAKGKVEIQIWLFSITDQLVKALAKAGFHLDTRDERLKMVFGTCDAALKEIAKMPEVERIEPLGN